MSSPHVTKSSVVDMIEQLKTEGVFTVKALAESLHVSPSALYKHYGDILPERKIENTEQKIIDAIRLLQAKTGTTKLKKADVIREAGISRTLLYRDYSHLHDYISGKKPLPLAKITDEVSYIVELETEVRKLKKELEELEAKRLVDIENGKKKIYSTIMQLDLDSFKATSTEASLNQLQIQNQDYIQSNKELIRKNSNFQIEITSLKERLAHTGGQTNTNVERLRPNYKLLEKVCLQKVPLKEIMRVFLEEERTFLDKASLHIRSIKPDLVIFFQPFFSCGYDQIPLVPRDKYVVIVESNEINLVNREQFVEVLPCPCLYIGADVSLNKTDFFCRTNQLSLHREFLQDIHTKRQFSSIEEGFVGAMIISPKS